MIDFATSQDDGKTQHDREAQAESKSKGHSSILDEKCGLQEKGRGRLEGNDQSTFSPLPHLSLKDEAGQQDFGDKNGALRAEAMDPQAYVTETDSKQSLFLAQNKVSLEKTTPQEPEIILDFFAGSGTTGHATLELNREDGGKRQFILVTNNEITELNPNGIAKDVTSKRLKRVMTGECYDGSKDFKWLEKNKPYGDSLEVSTIKEEVENSREIFEKIDESLYEKEFKSTDTKEKLQEKIEWVCQNFELTCRKLE